MSNCSSLVEVPQPFEELQEKLDMDIGLGPQAEFLEVQPNFGEGEVVAEFRGVGGRLEVIDLTEEEHADKVGSVPEEEQNTGISGEFDGEPGTEHKYGHGGISKAAVCPSNISITLLIDGLCDG
ncbi:hypothetical protein ACET3Z_014268 [Daucus carota]